MTSNQPKAVAAGRFTGINLPYVTLICGIASVGGFLYGFDTAVISGALRSLIVQFDLTQNPALQGWTVSSVLLGSMAGAALSGLVADRFGRKSALMLTAMLYLVSALGSTIAPSLDLFIIARLIGGVGVGIAAMVIPLYISEVSPPQIRGGMVSLYQLSIALGILAAYFTNGYVGRLSDQALGEGLRYLLEERWRAMLGSVIPPAGLFFLFLFLVPNSPRYLVMRGQPEQAFRILQKISNAQTATAEIQDIQKVLNQKPASFRSLFQVRLRIPTFIALFLAVVSQFSGIDLILHYGPIILENAGFSFQDSLDGQIIFGIILALFTGLAIWKVDSLGRRKLLFLGNAGVVVSLLAISALFASPAGNQTLLILAISVFIASFSFSLGPLPWIIMAEIFPTRVRGKAMSLGTVVLFTANWLLAQLFPWMAAEWGESLTFLLLGMAMLPTFIFLRTVLPETKGKSLEEIETSWLR